MKPQELADDKELMDSLMGRTITRAYGFDASPHSDWTHHETYWLWLDDGRIIEFSSWGHDADGATATEIEVMNVEKCVHCGEPHPDSQIFTPWQAGETGRYTYCTDGNNKSWREP